MSLFEKLRDDSEVALLIETLVIASEESITFFEVELTHLVRELDHETSSNVRLRGPGLGGGRIRWGPTIIGRAAHRVAQNKFFVSKVTKSYDIDSNRLLKRVLVETAKTLKWITSAYPSGTFFERLIGIERNILRALATPYLSACEVPNAFSAASILQTMRSRKPRYKMLARIATCRRAIDRARSVQDWTTLIAFLEPTSFIPINDDHLFEVYSLARTLQAIEATSARLVSLSLLTASRKGEIALFELKGRRIRVYFDNAPATGSWNHSKYRDLLEVYPSISYRPKRPDILVIVEGDDGRRNLIFLECKNSTDSTYVTTGIYKVFSYLKDLEALTSEGSTIAGILLIHTQPIVPIFSVDVAIANPESKAFISLIASLLPE